MADGEEAGVAVRRAEFPGRVAACKMILGACMRACTAGSVKLKTSPRRGGGETSSEWSGRLPPLEPSVGPPSWSDDGEVEVEEAEAGGSAHADADVAATSNPSVNAPSMRAGCEGL